MCIRASSKAVIVSGCKILLINCRSQFWGNFYDLPGGGQRKYESVEESIKRECLEETGYTVAIKRFLAFYEEIYAEPLRGRYPEYAHQLYHLFLCEPSNSVPQAISAGDKNQAGLAWITQDKIADVNLFPTLLRENLLPLLSEPTPRFLGTSCLNLQA